MYKTKFVIVSRLLFPGDADVVSVAGADIVLFFHCTINVSQ